MTGSSTFTAFQGRQRLITAPLRQTLSFLQAHAGGEDPTGPLLIFDDHSGRQVDFHLRGSLEDALERYDPAPTSGKSGPGRPKLGVVAREVTLLPRHWQWLEGQRGGASAALRRLIDEARKADPAGERRRQALNAVAGFLSVMAGDLPGYEDATRALYAGDGDTFEARIASWPTDIRVHALYLVAPAFEEA